RVDLTRRDEPLPDGQEGDPATAVTLEGVLGFVDVDVQPVAKVVRVWAEVVNPQHRLRDGLIAQDMTIQTAGERPAARGTTDK
ncbi:MAG: hypothetical protein U0992_25245, partial [Planctomycetaceae bacterium]